MFINSLHTQAHIKASIKRKQMISNTYTGILLVKEIFKCPVTVINNKFRTDTGRGNPTV